MRKHNRCRGFRIWKWGTFQIELWWFPKGEFIEPHIHERISSLIMVVYGQMEGIIGDRAGVPRPWKCFAVPPGERHAAHAVSNCVFLNFEHWTGEVTSASDDFTAV